MKAKTKIAIFAVAVLMTLAGFNMIASKSALALFHAGELSGYEVIVTAQVQSPIETPLPQ
ncbi:MAG: hypothetical protein ACYDH0_03485 [Candidatus Aminicenantales bacterium]